MPLLKWKLTPLDNLYYWTLSLVAKSLKRGRKRGRALGRVESKSKTSVAMILNDRGRKMFGKTRLAAKIEIRVFGVEIDQHHLKSPPSHKTAKNAILSSRERRFPWHLRLGENQSEAKSKRIELNFTRNLQAWTKMWRRRRRRPWRWRNLVSTSLLTSFILNAVF